MKISTTLDRKKMNKWLVCLILALLLVLSSLPVYAGAQQTEQTETPTITQDTGSESAESAASSEQNDIYPDEMISVQPNDTQETAVASYVLSEDPPYEANVLGGGYVGFKNKASGKYLTIPNGATVAGTNVCQQSAKDTANAQEFHLVYSHNFKKKFSYFTIYPVDASTGNACSTRVKASALDVGGQANVSLQVFLPTEMSDRWQIEHVEGNYYLIHMASKPYENGSRYVLAATSGEGTPSGTQTYSPGNVFVATMIDTDTPTASMLWEICVDGNPININSNDITQNSEQIVDIGDSIDYYYIPQSFNCTVTWSIQGSATMNIPGAVETNDYGTADISCTVTQSNTSIVESSRLRMMPPNGMSYYIQNAASKLYVNVEGHATAEGTYIQQSDCSQFYSGKWLLLHDSNNPGYVRLYSDACGKYMGVLTSDSTKVILTSAQTDSTLWKINTSDSHRRIIVSKLSEESGKVLNLSYSDQGNNANLLMITYLNNSDYRDEWIFWEALYTFRIEHYYDQGHETRFVNSEENIRAYQNVVSEILLQQFGVATIYSIYEYTSCADSCTGTPVTLSDTTASCSHFLQNHKKRKRIRNDLVNQFGSGTDIQTKVAWTGHVLEARASNSNSDSHTVVMTIGTVTDASNSNMSESAIRARYIYALLHELSHQLGAPDHYCYNESGETGNCDNPTNDCWCCDNGLSEEERPVCIMTSPYYDLESRLNSGNLEGIYCVQCLSSVHEKGILTHLEDHH